MCLHDPQPVHHKYFHEDYGNDFQTLQVHRIHYHKSDRHLQLVVSDLDEMIEHQSAAVSQLLCLWELY